MEGSEEGQRPRKATRIGWRGAGDKGGDPAHEIARYRAATMGGRTSLYRTTTVEEIVRCLDNGEEEIERCASVERETETEEGRSRAVVGLGIGSS